MIKGKTPEEIRKTFNIKNDFTPAEEEQVRVTIGLIFFLTNSWYRLYISLQWYQWIYMNATQLVFDIVI